MTTGPAEYDPISDPSTAVPRPLLLALTLILAACADRSAPAQTADPTPAETLSDWIGKSPVGEDGLSFVEEPSIRPALEQALSVEYGVLDKLSNLDSVATYTATPIEFVGGSFVIEYTPDEALADDDRRIWVVVNGDNGDVFTLLRSFTGGFPFYRPAVGVDREALSQETKDWVSERIRIPFDEIGSAPTSFDSSFR